MKSAIEQLREAAVPAVDLETGWAVELPLAEKIVGKLDSKYTDTLQILKAAIDDNETLQSENVALREKLERAYEDAAIACERLEAIEYDGRPDAPETATQIACAKAVRALASLTNPTKEGE